MTDPEQLSSTTTIDAPAGAIFAVLTDPAQHVAIDGTGWVEAPLDRDPLEAVGQRFGMRMYHQEHPDGHYQIVNEIVALEPDRVIAWRPGYCIGGDQLGFGGWLWRYDLRPDGERTVVSQTYDWSAATAEARERFQFPPFGVEKLERSLDNLADLAGQ